MKKVSIYILIAVYTLVQLRPLAAMLQDVVAHTFFAMQHMATIHYENGRYHLHQELKTINEQQQQAGAQKNTASNKTTESASPQNMAAEQPKLYRPAVFIAFHHSPGPGLQPGFTSSTFHPPLFA